MVFFDVTAKIAVPSSSGVGVWNILRCRPFVDFPNQGKLKTSCLQSKHVANAWIQPRTNLKAVGNCPTPLRAFNVSCRHAINASPWQSIPSAT